MTYALQDLSSIWVSELGRRVIEKEFVIVVVSAVIEHFHLT